MNHSRMLRAAFVLFLIVPAVSALTSDGHNITFLNSCDQPVWINLQGGPKGVCDGIIDNNTKKLKTCSACSMCPALNTATPSKLCNTSAATGDTQPMCCPGAVQEKLYCWNGNPCSRTTPPQCCSPNPEWGDDFGSYNCPGAGQTTGCGNTSMTQSQIDAMSGYNNPALNLSHLACNGSIISKGGFRLDASGGTRSFTFEKGWQGGFYPRTNCSFDESGVGSCETGNCLDTTGTGVLECGGAGSLPPVTKGEMNLDDPTDYYDVSWVDGFNIAMVIEPTQYDPGFNKNDPKHFCVAAGCSVSLLDFRSVAVPNWNVLKYTSPSNFVAIHSDCSLYSSYDKKVRNQTIWDGYCCPVSAGYVNDSTNKAQCKDSPVQPCKTCAGQNSKLFPFNQPGTLPNSAKLFYDVCPTAYAYTYNDTDALMQCRGDSKNLSSYRVTLSCPAHPTQTLVLEHRISSSLESGGNDYPMAVFMSDGGSSEIPMNFLFSNFSKAMGSTSTSDATIHHVHISLTSTLGETILRVEKDPGLGTVPELTGHVFTKYYRIDSPNLPAEKVGSATIEFSLDDDQMIPAGIKPDDIVLMRWDGTQWTELPTHYDFSSGGRAFFTAISPSFSYFVITNRVVSQASAGTTTKHRTTLPPDRTVPVTVTQGAVSHDTVPPTVPVTMISNQSTVPHQTDTAPGIPVLAVGIAITGCCAVGGVWYIRRWSIRRQNPALFRDKE